MIEKDQVIITSNFSDHPKDIFGKMQIAPTVQAQKLWELWKTNPTAFTIVPEYLVKKEENGVILEAELLGFSMVMKHAEKKDE